MSADATTEAKAIHLILATTPGTTVEEVRQDVREEALRLAREHGRLKG